MAKTPDGRENKAYILQVSSKAKSPAQYQRYAMGLPPRFFVFGYGGWSTPPGLERNFKAATQESTVAHIHGVSNLYDGGSLYISHRAFQEGSARFSEVAENGFRLFLMNLPASLNSMLPIHRIGLGFDLIHLQHYALSVE